MRGVLETGGLLLGDFHNNTDPSSSGSIPNMTVHYFLKGWRNGPPSMPQSVRPSRTVQLLCTHSNKYQCVCLCVSVRVCVCVCGQPLAQTCSMLTNSFFEWHPRSHDLLIVASSLLLCVRLYCTHTHIYIYVYVHILYMSYMCVRTCGVLDGQLILLHLVPERSQLYYEGRV